MQTNINPFNARSLTVALPSYLNPVSLVPPVSLHNTSDSAVLEISISLPSVTAIKTISKGGACRGTFQGVDFVLKYAYDGNRFPINCELLQEEANIYGKYLKQEQGRAVPRLFGYFKGKIEDEFQVACMILEDCGDAVSTAFRELPLEDRECIFKQVIALHECKVFPVDFVECNVVRKSKAGQNEYRLIDFHKEDVGHVCGWPKKSYLGEPAPTRMDLGCFLLHGIGKELKVWKPDPRRKTFAGQVVFDDDNELPDQITIDALIPQDRFTITWDLGSDIVKWLMRYKKMEDKISIEDYEKKFHFPTSSIYT